MANPNQRLTVLAATWFVAFLANGQPSGGGSGHGPTRVLQAFESAEAFNVVMSEGVEVRLAVEPGVMGDALRIDYEFVAGGGFGIVQFPAGLVLPVPEAGDFEFAFKVRGEGSANALEFKLLDVGGDLSLNAEKADVWWVNRRDFAPTKDWTTLRQKRRHITHAWGPKGGPAPTRVDKIEFAIASVNGGRGTLWFDELTYRTIEPAPNPLPTPTISLADEKHRTPVDVPLVLASGSPSIDIDIDLGYERDVDLVRLTWKNAVESPSSLSISTSVDGLTFSDAASFGRRNLAHADYPFPEVSAQYVRMTITPPQTNDAALIAYEIGNPGEGSDPLSLARRWAAQNPDEYPAYLRDIHSNWAVVGQPGDSEESLLGEQGVVEFGASTFSIEPRIVLPSDATEGGPRVLTPWNADVVTPAMNNDGLPMTTLNWMDVRLEVRPSMSIIGGERTLTVEYSLQNRGPDTRDGVFALVVSPLQVNPPWQFLNTRGGVGRVGALSLIQGGLLVNGTTPVRVQPEIPFTDLVTFEDRAWYEPFSPPAVGSERTAPVIDPRGLASAIGDVPFKLAAGGRSRWIVTAPFESSKPAIVAPANDPMSALMVDVPPAQQPLLDTLNANLNYILINADGPAIQPGSRCYERSWIRDGSLTSNALLAFGHHQQAVDFIDWYAKFLIPIGDDALKVPCVVDKRGADPVPENDSHGQYIFAVWNAYQFTRDRSILERHWPNVVKVVNYMDVLTGQRLTPEFADGGPSRQEPGKPAVPAAAFRGLMPESISHEGYSAKPMHSYWDDWFTLRGYEDAARIAVSLGRTDAADVLTKRAAEFRTSLSGSIALTMKAHGIDYLPGCVELGDFDATSTTTAVWPGHALDTTGLRPEFQATFDRYWDFFQKRATTNVWDAYTPYELRHVGVFVRLGQPDRAEAVLNWLMQHQRPQAWRQWAEVVWNDPTTPKFIGDMPHTWCGSDFINSFRAMLAYESDDDTQLHLFAGLTPAWFADGEVTRITSLPTHFGPLTAHIVATPTANGTRIVCNIDPGCVPPNGFILRTPTLPPTLGTLRSIRVNQRPVVPAADGTVTVPSASSTIEWVYSIQP